MEQWCEIRQRVLRDGESIRQLQRETGLHFDTIKKILAADFGACRQTSTTVGRLSLVRFDCNDYSVPVRYAHWGVLIKGYVDGVRIYRQDELIAEHDRRWDKEGIAFEPLHYLELLERKPGALDQARPLSQWRLPEYFQQLRRRLEQEGQGGGTQDYIRVLRRWRSIP